MNFSEQSTGPGKLHHQFFTVTHIYSNVTTIPTPAMQLDHTVRALTTFWPPLLMGVEQTIHLNPTTVLNRPTPCKIALLRKQIHFNQKL